VDRKLRLGERASRNAVASNSRANTAKDLRKRGEALLAKNLSPDDANEIRELIHQSAEAIKARNWSALSAKNDALRAGDWEAVRAAAGHSWRLVHSQEAAQVGFLAAAAGGRTDQALRWHARARSG